MLSGHKNSKKQGDVGMGVAIWWFATKGNTVCIPLTDSQDYDLVVEIEGLLAKVQVKTTRHKDRWDHYQANLRVFGGNKSGSSIKSFDKTTVDFLFITTNDGVMYLIPTCDIEAKNSLSLGPKWDRYIV